MGLIVCGFGGRPVTAGVGLKPVLVREEDTDRFAIVRDDQCGEWWTEAQLGRYEEESLVTRLKLPSHPWFEGAVLAYAHLDFVAPSEGDRAEQMVRLDPIDMQMESRLCVFVGFLSQEAAFRQLDGWAATCLVAAERALIRQFQQPHLEASVPIAFREALRARFVLAGREDGGARARRREAYVIAWTSLLLHGAPTEPLRRDAKLDYGHEELVELETRAVRRISDLSERPRTVRRTYRDGHGTYRRREEEACFI